MAAKRKASGLRIVKLRLPDGGRASEKDVWNTSLGGVFIGMRSPLAFGAEIGLEFDLVKAEYPADGQQISTVGTGDQASVFRPGLG